jgi:hypothetical protein
MTTEELNIKRYSTSELYELLDVMPSIKDRELEMVIVEKINKYKENKEICHFFSQVYDHFFESIEEKEDMNEEDENIQLQLNEEEQHDNTLRIENMSNMDTIMSISTPQSKETPQPKEVAVTNPVQYSKDNLNPLLNQTIKRTVVIDSQYKNNESQSSTSFTYDLSDPLRDVVSLKLYSVQIPYTWYTINKDFGSNFLLLKGSSPGINNGNNDYIIDISAGNYSAQNLVDTVNESFKRTKSKNTDISFGTTDISYNPFTSTATIHVEIKKYFNETSYYLFFPSFVNPILNPSPQQRSYTIPGYLGFDSSTIPINIIYSVKNILPYKSVTANQDENNSIFVLSTTDNSNNYVNIIQYLSTIKYDSNNNAYTTEQYDLSSTILQTITLQLSLPSGNYSRDQLQENLNTQLTTNPYLYDSSLARIDRTDAAFSYYNMTLQLNQSTTINEANTKIAIQFPNEPSNIYPYPIWTGTNSCFYFDSSYTEVSNLYGATLLLTSSFFVTNNPTIYIKCIESGYVNVLNDYIVNVANAPNPTVGYLLTEYIAAINAAFAVTNAQTANNDLTISGISLQSSTPTLLFNINHTFTTSNYGIDFTDSVLNYFFDLSYNGTDLSGNLPNPSTGFTFTGFLPVSSSYSIPVDQSLNTIPPTLLTIYPQSSLGNSNADPFIVPFVYTLSTNTAISGSNLIYLNHLDIASDINNSIALYLDQNNENPVTSTNGIYGAIVNNSYTLTLTVNALKNLSQNEYQVLLYDTINGQPSYEGDSWKTLLGFENDTYDLLSFSVPGKPYSEFQGTLSVVGETITLYDNSNNFFYIKPLPSADGLYTTTPGQFANSDFNDIRIDIPPGIYTTTIQLISAINNALTNNPLTNGSYISQTTINATTDQYTKFRLNVNKLFTANDYSIVFYDTVSFVKCYVGDKGVRNTTWDTTLGWILGYHNETTYILSDFTDPTTNIATMTGDTSVNVNLYNYLLLSVDDFNQNRLNDGIVTITKNQISLPLPSYSSMSNFTCDICGNQISSGSTNVATNNLTLNQVYSLNQILNAQQNQPKTYTTGPFVKDVFGFIPLRLTGLQNGQTFTETSGQLQQQNRLYFGPVNIHRMSVTLYTDKGTILDLNGTNFVFSFECEQLYQKQKI